jgi:CTP synthase
VTIGVVGKYVGLADAYKSLNEALAHGGVANRVKVNINWIDARTVRKGLTAIAAALDRVHGILVPGGFGERGSEGKIAAVRFARERKVPFFRHLFRHADGLHRSGAEPAGIEMAPVTEFGPTKSRFVGLMTEWMTGNEGSQTRPSWRSGRHHAPGPS